MLSDLPLNGIIQTLGPLLSRSLVSIWNLFPNMLVCFDIKHLLIFLLQRQAFQISLLRTAYVIIIILLSLNISILPFAFASVFVIRFILIVINRQIVLVVTGEGTKLELFQLVIVKLVEPTFVGGI